METKEKDAVSAPGSFEGVADPRVLLDGLFQHAPVGFQLFRADGRCIATNRAFRELFGAAPPPEYDLLRDDVLEQQGFLVLVRRALAGERVQAPAHWYDPKEFERLGVQHGRRVAVEVTLFPLREASGAVAHLALCFRDVTAELELQASAEALKRSQERFEATFEQAAVGVAHVAPDGRWLEVNRQLCEIVGYSREELLALSFQDITHPEDLDADLDFVRRMLAGELATYAMEKRYLRKGGAAIWIQLTVSLVRHATGVPNYFISVVQDISARKRAEDELHRAERAVRESEEHLATTLDSIGDGVIATDTGGRVSRMNRVAERLTGWPLEQARGLALREIFQIVNEDTRAPVEGPVERVLRDGVVVGLANHTVLLARDGVERPIADSAAPILDAHGALRGVVLVFRDQTEERRAELALRDSEARKSAILEAALDCIIAIDREGLITDFNPAAERTFGHPRAAVVGRPLHDLLIPPRLRERHRQGFDRYLASGDGPILGKRIEIEALRADGSEFPVELAVVPTRSRESLFFTGYIRDITERKRAEAATLSALEERARALEALRETEAQLRHSQKMEAIGTLAGSIAHDFNNLLTVILSYVDLLVPALPSTDPMRSDLTEIGRAANRATDLTRQLLAFSRRQLLQPRFLSLNETISAMTSMLRRIIGEDVELSAVLAPALGTVHVDPGQIEQVLLNLIVNARDAMPRGGKVTIETADAELDRDYASTHLDVQAGRYVVLSVSDTGLGMDRATQARIFEPFFTTKERGKGTGLGLSTVYGIVKQSGGSIWVYSEPGRGTTFKVYLPCSEEPPSRAADEPAPSAGLKGSETVLLVEDDQQVRALTMNILRRHGYHVLEASSGGDALLICEQYEGSVHLLLTDVVMPRMSGRQLWERLGPLRPGMKVLFMSGYTDDAIVRHGVLSSELDFVQKPLLPATLLAKVRAVLDRARTGRREE